MGSELFVLKVSDPLFQHFGETESVFFTYLSWIWSRFQSIADTWDDHNNSKST